MTEFNNFSSLMDLAATDTSDLKAQTSRLQKQGIYCIELNELKFSEQAPSDPADPMNYQLTMKGMILMFAPLVEGETSDGIEGRDLTERYFLFGKDLKQAIELLMGRFKTVGFKHKGLMGGVEGGPAGWIEEAYGKRVYVRIGHYTDKNEVERMRFDWLSPKQMEKAGIPWETLQRDFLDEKGEPVNLAA